MVVVLQTQQDIENLVPNLDKVSEIKDSFAVIVAAKGNDVDFVSRFFASNAGIPEDPATGSAHCSLIPFWAERLGKTKMNAKQLSKRQGELYCEHNDDRVSMGGTLLCL